MKPQALIDELVDLGIYRVSDYDNEYEANQEFMTYTDSNEKIRKVEDSNITDEEIKLLLSAKQTKHLRKIASMITILVVITILGACYWAYLFFKIKTMF
jgi:hypothetical protein